MANQNQTPNSTPNQTPGQTPGQTANQPKSPSRRDESVTRHDQLSKPYNQGGPSLDGNSKRQDQSGNNPNDLKRQNQDDANQSGSGLQAGDEQEDDLLEGREGDELDEGGGQDIRAEGEEGEDEDMPADDLVNRKQNRNAGRESDGTRPR